MINYEELLDCLDNEPEQTICVGIEDGLEIWVDGIERACAEAIRELIDDNIRLKNQIRAQQIEIEKTINGLDKKDVLQTKRMKQNELVAQIQMKLIKDLNGENEELKTQSNNWELASSNWEHLAMLAAKDSREITADRDRLLTELIKHCPISSRPHGEKK